MRNCANCEMSFGDRGKGFFLYCSDDCAYQAKRKRWRNYEQQNKEVRNAKSLNYARSHQEQGRVRAARWYRENPEKHANKPSEVRRRIEAKARREARKQARDQYAAIMETSLQMEALRWHFYGDDFSKDSRGWRNGRKLTQEEITDRQRKRTREQHQKERAALKIFRELGFSVSKKDRHLIYRALKAELPNLNM